MKDQTSSQMPVLVIVSGYFSPLHCGHLDYLEQAASVADQLIVIVNNNEQQILKKGKLILDEQDRLRIILALEIVDEALIAVDQDRSVAKTLALIADSNPKANLIFGNGGDRNSEDDIPEKDICDQYGIEMVFDFGGTEKRDSSTRINQELGN
ncbi:MAG: adenylyltransferase/cytidyltransferase family protein [Actinomycetota bacterium]